VRLNSRGGVLVTSRLDVLLLILPVLIVLNFVFPRAVERTLYLALFALGAIHVLVGGRLTTIGLWFAQALGLGGAVYFGAFAGSLLLH